MATSSSKLHKIGVAILAAGITGAAIIYFLGNRTTTDDDDPSMIGFNKRQNEQMEQMYGKSGQLMDDLTNSLKKPSTQAGIILAVSIVSSLVCFRLAESPGENEIEK